jgi:hypothetical protein
MLVLPALVFPGLARAAKLPPMTIYKTASCGCCNGWITHVRRAGFAPRIVVQEDISPAFRRHGVPFELSSCHVAEVGGYVAVGHVPPADLLRLLKQRPKAIGLTVPGMPWGSPGMERPDGKREPYETLLLLRGGKTRVFARHV